MRTINLTSERFLSFANFAGEDFFFSKKNFYRPPIFHSRARKIRLLIIIIILIKLIYAELGGLRALSPPLHITIEVTSNKLTFRAT